MTTVTCAESAVDRKVLFRKEYKRMISGVCYIFSSKTSRSSPFLPRRHFKKPHAYFGWPDGSVRRSPASLLPIVAGSTGCLLQLLSHKCKFCEGTCCRLVHIARETSCLREWSPIKSLACRNMIKNKASEFRCNLTKGEGAIHCFISGCGFEECVHTRPCALLLQHPPFRWSMTTKMTPQWTCSSTWLSHHSRRRKVQRVESIQAISCWANTKILKLNQPGCLE